MYVTSGWACKVGVSKFGFMRIRLLRRLLPTEIVKDHYASVRGLRRCVGGHLRRLFGKISEAFIETGPHGTSERAAFRLFPVTATPRDQAAGGLREKTGTLHCL